MAHLGSWSEDVIDDMCDYFEVDQNGGRGAKEERLKRKFTKKMSDVLWMHVQADLNMKELRKLGEPHGLTAREKWRLRVKLAEKHIKPPGFDNQLSAKKVADDKARLAAVNAEAKKKKADEEAKKAEEAAKRASRTDAHDDKADADAANRAADQAALIHRLASDHAATLAMLRDQQEAHQQLISQMQIENRKRDEMAEHVRDARDEEARIRQEAILAGMKRLQEDNKLLLERSARQEQRQLYAERKLDAISRSLLEYLPSIDHKINAMVSGEHDVRIRYFMLLPKDVHSGRLRRIDPRTWLNDDVYLIPCYPSPIGEDGRGGALVPARVSREGGFLLSQPKNFVREHKMLIKVSLTLLKLGIVAAGAQAGIKVGELDLFDLNWEALNIGEMILAADKDLGDGLNLNDIALQEGAADFDQAAQTQIRKQVCAEDAEALADQLNMPDARRLTQAQYRTLKETLDSKLPGWQDECGLDDWITDKSNSEVPILYLPKDDPRILQKYADIEECKQREEEEHMQREKDEKEREATEAKLAQEEADRKQREKEATEAEEAEAADLEAAKTNAEKAKATLSLWSTAVGENARRNAEEISNETGRSESPSSSVKEMDSEQTEREPHAAGEACPCCCLQ